MKRALLIGINYIGTENQLNGCINDVRNVRSMLMDQFGYEQKNTVMLTDRTSIPATRANILAQLDSIIQLTNKDNGELWIHYSGHGSFTVDRNRDESDGRDEMIVPMDFQTSGMIIDDDIHKILSKLNSESKCILIFDCCHSGTIADLPFCYKKGSSYMENRSTDIKSNILMISGCKDDQTSADTVINGEPAGALTGFLLNILKVAGYNISVNNLCESLWNSLKSSGYVQYPILSSSKEIDKTRSFCSGGQLWPPVPKVVRVKRR